MDVLTCILTGGVAAALVKILDTVIQWLLQRKGKKDDAKIETKLNQAERSRAVCEGMKVILFDRIRYLSQEFLAAGGVDFDDRRNLHEMHRVYHDGLGGDGDLDALVEAVDRLPLKTK